MDLRYQIEKILGKNRRASTLTQYKNRGQIKRFCDLIQHKYGLENIRHLKTKHIRGAFQDLKEKGLSPSSLASYATAARTVAEAVGKKNIVPKNNKEMGISRAGDRLKPIEANMDKIHEITAQLYQQSEWLGLAAELREQFGLRAKESLLSTEVRDGRLIVRGAKGGRPREIPIRNKSQQTLLARIQDHLRREGKASLVPAHMSLKQGLKYQSNTIYRLGATKKNKAHPHASRHEYAQQMAKEGQSKSAISQELGHGREEVISHYVPK